MVEALDALGFTLVGVAPDGVGHRFIKGVIAVDLLAPDGLGERSDLALLAGARTTSIAGGSFALSRSQLVEVGSSGRSARVPRPDLVGAVLIKAVAAIKDRHPERHLRDLTFLLSLVSDPLQLKAGLGAKNARRLARVTALADAGDEAWRLLDPAARVAAMSTFTIATGIEVAESD